MTGNRFKRPIFVAIHDVLVAGLSFVLSLYLRLGDDLWVQASSYLVVGTLIFAAVCGAVFWGMRLYRGLWRYASLADLMTLVKGATLAILIFVPILFMVTRLELFPRSALFINWFVLIIMVGAPRCLYRIIKDGTLSGRPEAVARNGIPVLLVGAGDAADLFIRELSRDGASANYRIVGLVDDHAKYAGTEIHGVPVLGTTADIKSAIEKLARRQMRPRRLIITDPRIRGEAVRRLLDTADALGLTVARLPKLTDFKRGEDGPIEARPIAIADLLGRPQTLLDREGMRGLIGGRRVMITGAGGTIGGELARQVAGFGPAHLSLLDNAELNLYEIDMALAERWPGISRKPILADVRDRSRVDMILGEEHPNLVFHAAAFKHVPMVETNPNEGVMTNVVGTRNVADACRAAGIEAMVLISTDKAVNPTSVMGATKHIAEAYCQALGRAVLNDAGSRFITVRFGNVLGSTGSVVPLFKRQIESGGPVTVTHPEMSRYFMTVREAVELVLQASVLGVEPSREGGEIYVLDMGEPIRIQDLARKMIRLAGLHPDSDIKIVFTGVRLGEKLREALFHSGEKRVHTEREGIRLADSRPANLGELNPFIDDLAQAAADGRTSDTLALIGRMVPEFENQGESERNLGVGG